MARSLKVYIAQSIGLYEGPNATMVKTQERLWDNTADVYVVATTKTEAGQYVKRVFGILPTLNELRVAGGNASRDLIADGYLRESGEVVAFRSYQHSWPIVQSLPGAEAQIVAEWRCDRSTDFKLVIVRH
jgi:hypothetical protein